MLIQKSNIVINEIFDKKKWLCCLEQNFIVQLKMENQFIQVIYVYMYK